MKKKNYLSAALLMAGMAAMSSCSENEASQSIPDDGAIRFAANTEFGTRAGDVTTNNLSAFNVYAYTVSDAGSSLFMDNVKVSKTSGNTWEYSPLKYWPADKVDFYAYAPESWIGTSGVLAPVKYSDSKADTDLVYAVAKGLEGNGSQANGQVILNFRHALSKVTLLLSSTDSALKVNVTNVALANIKSTGEFSFPENTTAGSPDAQSTGTWANLADGYTYLFHMSSTQDEVVTLTETPTDLSESGLGGPKFFIPQPLVWKSSGAADDTYITLMCSVYDAKTGVKLWPNANTPKENLMEGSSNNDGLLKFPLSTDKFSEWQPGYHYVYNIIVNANSDMNPIEFGNPTVDTFVEVETNYQ